MRRVLITVAVVAAVVSQTSCNRRVFEGVQKSCYKTIAADVDVPLDKKADILIVVDNSLSMADEQQNLVRNFLNENAAECPLQNLAAIPDDFKNPTRDKYTDGGELSQCGFIQLLAA